MTIATTPSLRRNPGNIPISITRDRKTSIVTATGFRFRATTGAGRLMLTPGGSLTATAAGCRTPTIGWTWVGYEPWGWAPYHYGRWFFYGGNWCWWPGVGFNGPRPIWGPGFVAFLGFGGGTGGPGSGVGFDSIGWCPLGPRDPFNPWWGRGRGFNMTDISNLNAVAATKSNDPGGQTYGSNLQGIMTNTNLRAAITAVSAQNFASGRIAHNLQAVDANMLQQASLIQGTLPVTPTQASLQPVNRPVNPAALPPRQQSISISLPGAREPASRASLPAGQSIPMVNDQRAGANVPARAGSMAPSTRSGVVGSRTEHLNRRPDRAAFGRAAWNAGRLEEVWSERPDHTLN